MRLSASLHLVRHGRSALQHDGRWYRARDVHLYEAAYDAEGIRADPAPPGHLLALARNADVLIASDMRRAIESARHLAPDRAPTIVPELRELRLEPPGWVPMRLPIAVWDAMSHVQWSMRLLHRTDHETARRAALAVDALLDATRVGASVVAVTHGGIRRLIAAELLRRGATSVGRTGGYANWSCWTLR